MAYNFFQEIQSITCGIMNKLMNDHLFSVVRTGISCWCLFFMMMPVFQAQAALPAIVDEQPLPSLAPILERVMPAVVNVHTQTRVRSRSRFSNDPLFRQFFGLPRERVAQSLGSGVVVDADQGIILTNNHVIEGADDIQVTLSNGQSYRAELLGTDPDTDLAVIRIDTELDLSELPLADSDELRVGDFVVAVGNPFGLGQTVTSGIVSALGRRGLRGLNYQNFIQTDASINPGNSGGALINLRGELIGINTAIFSPSGGNVGIGFAIPARIASSVMGELLEFGFVRRGRLGVDVQNIDQRLAEVLDLDTPSGALITRVVADSPAAKSGLESGDVIVRLNDQQIVDADALRNAEGLLPVGQKLTLVLVRDGKPLTLEASLNQAAFLDGDELHLLLSGAKLMDLDRQSQEQTGLDGVVLAAVNQGSRAWEAGLRQGDLIRGVNRRPVSGLPELKKLLKGRNRKVITILRGRRYFSLALE